MTRSEAEQERAELAAGHPDRATHSFILSERDGDWTVAKVALPPSLAAGATPGEPGTAEPLHDHSGTRLPGGIPNWSAL